MPFVDNQGIQIHY